jgi:hypothetical protein
MKTDFSSPSFAGSLAVSKAQIFEAKARDAERLARDVPTLRQVYNELVAVWRRLARQATTFGTA